MMAIRMGPRLVFDWDLPSFVLQPLVENTIHPGLTPQVSCGRIEVQAKGQQLELTVPDRGRGSGSDCGS